MLKYTAQFKFEAHNFLFKIKKIHSNSLNIDDFTAIFVKFLKFVYKMASQKDYLSIKQVMARLHAENESELDSDSLSGIEEETDASAIIIIMALLVVHPRGGSSPTNYKFKKLYIYI